VAARLGHTDATRALCEAGASVHGVTPHQSTALHLAALEGHTGVMRVLLEYGADKDARKRHDFTPLISAASGGSVEACRVLVEAGASTRTLAAFGLSAVHAAAHRGSCAVIEYLASIGASVGLAKSDGVTPLHAAAEASRSAACSLLLRLGAPPSPRCQAGSTPLHRAVCVKTDSADAAAAVVDTVAALLRGGASAAAASNRQRLALHYAVSTGLDTVCEMLLRAGSPVDTPDMTGVTPAAVAAAGDRVGALRILLRHGADPLHQWESREDGEPPLSVLSVSKEGESHDMVLRWSRGEDEEQLATSAVRAVSDRNTLPELAAICASYLISPAARSRDRGVEEPGAKRRRTA
jgi:ankyrin repeat protein